MDIQNGIYCYRKTYQCRVDSSQISYCKIIHYFSSYFKKQYHTKTFQMQVTHVKEICSLMSYIMFLVMSISEKNETCNLSLTNSTLDKHGQNVIWQFNNARLSCFKSKTCKCIQKTSLCGHFTYSWQLVMRLNMRVKSHGNNKVAQWNPLF